MLWTTTRFPVILVSSCLFTLAFGVAMLMRQMFADELPMALVANRNTTAVHVAGRESYLAGKVWANERTLERRIVAETPFARCELHRVRSEDGSSVVEDWLWLEQMNVINVAVMNEDGNFILIRQRKYGIRGESLSPVGGMIEGGETPFHAARREVLEELGLGSRRTLELTGQGPVENEHISSGGPVVDSYGDVVGTVPEDEVDWIYLGKYRTAANRGGGFSFSYLLKNAVAMEPGGGTNEHRARGDYEAQDIIQMSPQDVQIALGNADFKEIRWAATMNFALLHLQYGIF